MGADVLGHAECKDTVVAKYLGHLLVGDEVLLVLRVLQAVLLDVDPEQLDNLTTTGLILADDICQLRRNLFGFCEAASSGHDGRHWSGCRTCSGGWRIN